MSRKCPCSGLNLLDYVEEPPSLAVWLLSKGIGRLSLAGSVDSFDSEGSNNGNNSYLSFRKVYSISKIAFVIFFNAVNIKWHF